MIDRDVNWRNHRWSFDCDYTEREETPLLTTLLEKWGIWFDDVYGYSFHGKKRYVIRWPHLGGIRWNYRVPTERRKDPFQKKLELEVKV